MIITSKLKPYNYVYYIALETIKQCANYLY